MDQVLAVGIKHKEQVRFVAEPAPQPGYTNVSLVGARNSFLELKLNKVLSDRLYQRQLGEDSLSFADNLHLPNKPTHRRSEHCHHHEQRSQREAKPAAAVRGGHGNRFQVSERRRRQTKGAAASKQTKESRPATSSRQCVASKYSYSAIWWPCISLPVATTRSVNSGGSITNEQAIAEHVTSHNSQARLNRTLVNSSWSLAPRMSFASIGGLRLDFSRHRSGVQWQSKNCGASWSLLV